MRLNLPRYNCIRFRLFSEFSVAMDRDAEFQSLMDQTATHTHDPIEGSEEGTRVAFFGSRSRVKGITHKVLGSLERAPRENGLGFTLSITYARAYDSLPSPPREMRPVSLLVDAASRLFGPVSVTCSTVFRYDQTEGFKSKISFPMPLIVQDETDGITHLESARFSRRDSGDIRYWISVSNSEDTESFSHSIDFESTLVLNPKSVRELLDRARSISTHLIILEGGD